ncbi:3' terminal RNA ribose 2'-O-methyltransferase Hen1 [Natronospira proteinivora]|uniref:Small RNA 2'-O-methyltransferase n=1 Tax=Natronospira proteinivora TaxID=1807133 RepID=A0ABT1G7Y4_9GAMM|nr:methyltransferase [Natronospira proteinivora]MCP1727416.1 3' terminal RNA ribose 2'-O-methyltransferase Hen1 [Natronospira proteinivora]
MPSPLHEERLQTILSQLRCDGVRSVQDLGCGTGELLMRLREEPRFEKVVGIDIDEKALQAARRTLGLDPLDQSARVRVHRASFEETDRRLKGFDAAVMLETIEHIEPGRLSRVEGAVFGHARPHLVLVTTPNAEYNPVHGMAPGEKRHPGHYFEWDRAKFRHWAYGVAERQGYQVRFFDIGPVYPGLGSSTQMARFQLAEAQLGQSA